MKRVDFDPTGARNPQNRGKSGYVRIGWDEALDIVAKEINRQKRVHGPGSITFPCRPTTSGATSAITSARSRVSPT